MSPRTRSLLVLLCLVAGCSGFYTISLRTLRVYSQNQNTAKEAIGELSLYFNVSLFGEVNGDCESLIAAAQKEQKYGSSLIILDKEESNGKDCRQGVLWNHAKLLDLNSRDRSQRSLFNFDGRRRRNGNTFSWKKYAMELNDDKTFSSVERFQPFVETTPVSPTTEATKEEEKATGILIPVWTLVVTAIVVLLLLAVVAFLVWWTLRNRKSEKSVEEGDPKKTKEEKIPEPAKAKGPESTKTETTKSETERTVKRVEEKTQRTVKKVEEKTQKTSATGGSESENKKRSPPKSTVELSSEGAENPPKRSGEVIKASPPAPPPERTESSKLTEAVTSVEFEYYLNKLARFAIDYYDDPTGYSVTTAKKPGFLYKMFPRVAPEKPLQFTNMMNFFNSNVMQGLTHWQHPRFHAYFATGRSYPDMLADVLISSLGVVGFSWDSCPALTEMEHAMVNWLGRAMGIPETHLFQDDPASSVGGGCYFESASEAIFCSMLAARQWKISQLAGKQVHRIDNGRVHYDLEAIHEHCRKLVYYTSKDAHSSSEKGCKMAMVRCRPIQSTRENEWGLTGYQLEKEIYKDIQRGLVPTYVCVTLGTTSTAACDHLESIWPVAEKHNMYIHVDAAYAGMFWMDPKHRSRCRGLEHAWSINSNMHKALLHSATASVFFCRDKKLHMDAFAVTPVYLKPSHANAIDLRDWGVNLSRRFKAIKTWFIIGFYGLHGLRDYVKRVVDLGEYFMELVAKHPNCRIFGKCNFGLFVFQYVEPGMDQKQINEATTALCRYMNESNKLFFTHTKVHCHNLIRVVITYERSTKTTIDQSWCVMQELIEEFKQNRADIVLQAQKRLEAPLPGRQRAPMPGDEDIDIVGSENPMTDSTRSNTSIDTAKLPASSLEKAGNSAENSEIKPDTTKK